MAKDNSALTQFSLQPLAGFLQRAHARPACDTPPLSPVQPRAQFHSQIPRLMSYSSGLRNWPKSGGKLPIRCRRQRSVEMRQRFSSALFFLGLEEREVGGLGEACGPVITELFVGSVGELHLIASCAESCAFFLLLFFFIFVFSDLFHSAFHLFLRHVFLACSLCFLFFPFLRREGRFLKLGSVSFST